MKRKKNLIYNILLILCIIVFVCCGIYLFRYYRESAKNKDLVKSLKEKIKEDDEQPDRKEENKEDEKKEPATIVVGEDTVLKRYEELYEMNPDFIGWITIEGTSVDHPVMFTPDNEQKYLRKNFEGSYALAGTMFLGAKSDPKKPSLNLIIYGHNMQDGTMFSDILKYKDQEFYEAHPLIHFDTIYKRNTYEIIAAFHTQLLYSDDSFHYEDFYDTEVPAIYDYYIQESLKRSQISTGKTAAFGDHLLTLSTCENYGAREGNRFVVVAREKKD